MPLKKKITQLKFSFSLLCILAISMAIYLLILNYRQSQTQSTLQLALVREITHVVTEKVTHYLKPVVAISEMSSELVRQGVLDVTNVTQLEAYSMVMLRSNSYLDAFYLGDKYGNFLMTRRLENKTLQTKIIRRAEKRPYMLIKNRNRFQSIISSTTTKNIDFDPRERPWYIGAKEYERRYWTDVYLFHTANELGITGAFPVYNKKGRFFGIFGVDVTLGSVSDFLKQQKLSPNTVLMIVDDHYRVVADSESLSRPERGVSEPLDVSSIQYESVQRAFSLYKGTKSKDVKTRLFTFNLHRVNYLASFEPFPSSLGYDWTLVFIGPLKDYLK